MILFLSMQPLLWHYGPVKPSRGCFNQEIASRWQLHGETFKYKRSPDVVEVSQYSMAYWLIDNFEQPRNNVVKTRLAYIVVSLIYMTCYT